MNKRLPLYQETKRKHILYVERLVMMVNLYMHLSILLM